MGANTSKHFDFNIPSTAPGQGHGANATQEVNILVSTSYQLSSITSRQARRRTIIHYLCKRKQNMAQSTCAESTNKGVH